MPADKSKPKRPATATGAGASSPWAVADPDSGARRGGGAGPLDRRIVTDQDALLDDYHAPTAPMPSASSSSSRPGGLSVQPRRKTPAPQSTAAANNGRRNSRRGSKASIHSISSATTSTGRRSSLPTLSLATPPSSASPMAVDGPTFVNPWDEPADPELYSSLQNFKFGDASSPEADGGARVGPLALPPYRRPSADRTPRQSVSGPSGGTRRRPDTGDAAADRRAATRGKMPALAPDGGARRPSLPVNEPSASGSSASEAEELHADLDTDVELDAPGFLARRAARRGELSDTASVNTFGGPSFSGTSEGEPGSPMTFAERGLDASDDEFGRYDDDDEYWAPPRSASLVVSAGDDCYALPAPPPPRERQGSQGTLRIATDRDGGFLRPELSPSMGGSLQSAVAVPPAVPEEPAQMAEEPDPVSATTTTTTSNTTNTTTISPTMTATSSTAVSLDMGSATGAYDGWDINYIFGADGTAAGSRRPSAYAPSLVGSASLSSGRRPSAQSFAFAGWGKDATAALRRGSAATSRSGGSDDVFMRHVRANDGAYAAREREWTFAKEKAEGPRDLRPPGPIGDTRTRGSAPVGQQEIWRCEHVGRFKADRAVFRTDPAKPLQHRLNIRHIPDPYSKGNTRGGPSTIVHRHSRALAYSIFREHDLQVIRRSGSGMMSMNLGILLAPKRVQLQYTQTKTTKALNDHGLLDARPARSASTTTTASSADGEHRRSASRSRKERERERKERERRDKDGRKRGKGKERDGDAPAGWAAAPLSPASGTSSAAPSLAGSGWASGSSSARESMSPEPAGWDARPAPAQPPSAPAEFDPDVDGPPVQKTTHREAFATLDSTYFEQARVRGERPAGSGGFARFKRIFIGGGSSSAPAPLEGKYEPPWITMAPRSHQEEQERAIANLNESFKDVGLLPSVDSRRRHKGEGGARSTRADDGEDVFAFVPDDGLFMLVPLWPKETEAALREEPAPFIPPLERRQYLVVYYRKQEEGRKRKKDKDKDRDAPAEPPLVPDAPPAPDDPGQLRAFHVCARLVGYAQLRTSGVRVPSFGLSVTGRLRDAAAAIPPPDVRARELDPVVIALWHGRARGLELVPEPLEKLGLCAPRAEEDDPDEAVPLSVLGRAVAELAWLGGMALTSFGPA